MEPPLSGSDEDNEETPSRRYGGVPSAVKAAGFSREESESYYGQNYHERKGVAYLISQSFHDGMKAVKKIPEEDVDICLRLAMLARWSRICTAERLY